MIIPGTLHYKEETVEPPEGLNNSYFPLPEISYWAIKLLNLAHLDGSGSTIL